MTSNPADPTKPFAALHQDDAIRLFSDYLRVTGVAHTSPEPQGDPRLIGKRLGLLNGSSWITLWANYFGRMYLPGVHLVNVGNEAVQINFMEAHTAGSASLPAANLAAFERYAIDLAELGHVDAVLITCSTMNRAYRQVREALKPYRHPSLPDRPSHDGTRRGAWTAGSWLLPPMAPPWKARRRCSAKWPGRPAARSA